MAEPKAPTVRSSGTSARVLLNLPARARRGEVITLSALIGHVMETGFRPDGMGRTVPRDILRRFTCTYAGELVFSADLNPAIAANPYLAFHTVATVSGEIEFRWIGDQGFDHIEVVRLEVEA